MLRLCPLDFGLSNHSYAPGLWRTCNNQVFMVSQEVLGSPPFIGNRMIQLFSFAGVTYTLYNYIRLRTVITLA